MALRRWSISLRIVVTLILIVITALMVFRYGHNALFVLGVSALFASKVLGAVLNEVVATIVTIMIVMPVLNVVICELISWAFRSGARRIKREEREAQLIVPPPHAISAGTCTIRGRAERHAARRLGVSTPPPCAAAGRA